MRLRIVLPDQPSALAAVTRLIADEEANIVEVWHQRTFTRRALESAEVDLMLETRGHDHASRVCERLGQNGYPARMLDRPE